MSVFEKLDNRFTAQCKERRDHAIAIIGHKNYIDNWDSRMVRDLSADMDICYFDDFEFKYTINRYINSRINAGDANPACDRDLDDVRLYTG